MEALVEVMAASLASRPRRHLVVHQAFMVRSVPTNGGTRWQILDRG
jgi:hypothetical protein